MSFTARSRSWRPDTAHLRSARDGRAPVGGGHLDDRHRDQRRRASLVRARHDRLTGPDGNRRKTNEFGKSDAERDRILHDLATVEPLLRAVATAEIDTRAPLAEVVDALERIADAAASR